MTQSESIWVDLIQISKMIKIVWQLLLKVSNLSNFWIYIYFCLWSRLWDSRSSKLPNRQTHTMHVWSIYQHLPLTNHHTSPSLGKYAQHRVAIRWWCPTHFQTHDTPKYHINLVSYLPKDLPAVCIPWSSMRSHEIPWDPMAGMGWSPWLTPEEENTTMFCPPHPWLNSNLGYNTNKNGVIPWNAENIPSFSIDSILVYCN